MCHVSHLHGALPAGVGCDILPAKEHCVSWYLQQVVHTTQECGLAAAVGTHHGIETAFGNVETDIAEHLLLPEGIG